MGIGLAVPLALLGAAYAAWAISDRLLYIGPLDRAKFGWLVVLPLLMATPIATGFAWRRLQGMQIGLAASAIVAIVGTIAGVIYGVAVVADSQGCQFGTRLSGGDIGFAAVVVGLVTGGGYAASGLAAAVLMRNRHPWLGGLAGALGGFAVLWVAVFAALGSIGGVGICNRPPVI
jgi:hypothetical protein